MKDLYRSLALCCFAVVPALAQEADTAAIVEGCSACHRGDLDLSAQSAADLTEAMKAIAGGDAEHVVPLPQLSEDDLLAVAQALAGAGD